MTTPAAPAASTSASTSSSTPLVSTHDLRVHFPVRGGTLARLRRATATAHAASNVVRSVDGVSLDIHRGETLGLVGESGCGKTTFGRALLRLIEPTGGRIRFGDVDLTSLSSGALRRQRRHMQMIFQDPYASLDPRMTVGQIIAEPIDTLHRAWRRTARPRTRADGHRRPQRAVHQPLSA